MPARYYKHTAQIAIALGGRREVMIPDRIHQRLCRLVRLLCFTLAIGDLAADAWLLLCSSSS